jgi:hypothetical protein
MSPLQPPRGDELMIFTLRYTGDLKSSGNTGGRGKDKQGLREHFHPQLERIWSRHTVLKKINRETLTEPVKAQDRWEPPYPNALKIDSHLFRCMVRGASFIPLITASMEVHCHLSLRIGRPVRVGTIFAGGDIDGRLKTLFDALTVPKDDGQVPDGTTAREYLCLLSDDDLITALSISSYELLGGATENWVDIDLEVTITAVTPMAATSVLMFGG